MKEQVVIRNKTMQDKKVIKDGVEEKKLIADLQYLGNTSTDGQILSPLSSYC